MSFEPFLQSLGIHNFGLFVISGLLLNITPGPDNLYIIARSTQWGIRAGLIAVCGICAGCLVHVVAASLGISTLLLSSARAFEVVKMLGGLYLLYLGLQMLMTQSTQQAAPTTPIEPHQQIRQGAHFFQGALTNILNPKVALFFLAFLPQFIAADATNKSLAFFLLGVVFVFNASLWCFFLAWLASRLTHWLAPSGKPMLWFQRILGALFIVMAARLAFMRN